MPRWWRSSNVPSAGVLTGVVQERALFLLYGAQGHNGKTTLVEVVRDLLGTSGEEGFGYARKVDVMTFMKSKKL